MPWRYSGPRSCSVEVPAGTRAGWHGTAKRVVCPCLPREGPQGVPGHPLGPCPGLADVPSSTLAFKIGTKGFGSGRCD